MVKKIIKKKKCKKLDDELIDKFRKVVDDSKKYLDDKSIEKLELSIVGQFPEISFDDNVIDPSVGKCPEC